MDDSTSRRGWGFTIGAAAAVGAALAIGWAGGVRGAAADDDGPEKGAAPAKKAPAESPTADWHEDPDCRLVFFATLEGLYTDGIPNEVVDLILGTDAKLSSGVKQNFVFRCKLCHAVYDAFALYRARPTFHGSERDTFGAGEVEPRVVEALRSGEARTRVYAMGELVQPWIKRKLLTLQIDDVEKKALMTRLLELVDEGNQLMSKHRRDDPEYGDDWSFYGSCQACKAVETVSRMMPREGEGD